jgi:predicted ABC-type ATPase
VNDCRLLYSFCVGAHSSESWVGNFDMNPSEGGVPTQARYLDCHAKCFEGVFRGKATADPKAMLLMGAPASGKSHFQRNHPPPLEAVVIDPDRFKACLPEYDNGKGATFVHEESSWLAAQARAVAMGRGCSLVNDAVGASAGKYATLIRRLRANGYWIELVCVHILSVDEVIRRALFRSTKPNGRMVPEPVVRAAHSKIPLSTL